MIDARPRLLDRPSRRVVNRQHQTWRSARWVRVAILIAILVVLQLSIFWGYLSGATIPSWDFVGSYNTVAFIWWTDGNFFSPVEWIPNSLGGFPAALSLQVSGWYLPVGMMAAFGPFTLHASAALAALHVGFGFVGTFALVRSFRVTFFSSTLAAVAGFFAIGYFSNAAHVDIVRGYAWVPWVLLILSPKWPWRKWWGVAVAAFLLWQAATGSYPGMVIAMVYVGIVWVVAYQLIAKVPLKHFVLPLALSGVIAAMLCVPRLLPYFMLGSDTASAAAFEDTSKFDASLLGTVLFGYGQSGFPNDLSMNSYFVPATILALLFFASIKDRITKLAISIGVPAAVLGLPFLPWFQAAQSLPGLSLSRFTASDFKPFLVLAAVMLAASGLQQLLRRNGYSQRSFWGRVSLVAMFALALALVRKEGPFTRLDWLPGFSILLSCVLLILLIRLSKSGEIRNVLGAILIALTGVSGAVWAYTTPLPWSHPRIATEIEAYGATVDELISDRAESLTLSQRPPRISLPEGLPPRIDAYWHRAHYLGIDAVGGFINAKGSKTIELINGNLLSAESGEDFTAFLAGPGLVYAGEATAEAGADCAREARCGPISVTPMKYSAGDLTYGITLDSPAVLTLNEAYYEGWVAEACNSEVGCVDLDPHRSAMGLVELNGPAGQFELRVHYEAPGRTSSNVVFVLGCLLVFVSCIWAPLRSRSRKLITDVSVT